MLIFFCLENNEHLFPWVWNIHGLVNVCRLFLIIFTFLYCSVVSRESFLVELISSGELVLK